ncbi:beta-ketoacyl-[acyl-carrier-protein] synthase family protein [Roseinatronobacter alkalisoli]|uniref:Beta-ketoacyl-[acyl-carrier-protein] synthase family protein n=1 Tax=Roseinatronobacter alkalisoli TaxID=3028235 RepID=A0ABT5T468_9RHOB|nr:beta-ketoacyl-[acyl-carrier-protein] synthase family protein [Roseinatronobacter sp. HJB301]MDD7969915.1 beta-ketoacyl-[acyl-carrier-protein] synthase family protein [Roseinatronobacter sp. HJB301]
MRRVVITGVGTLNALGGDYATTAAAMQAGKCGIGPLTCRDVDRLTVRVGAEIQGFEPEQHFARNALPLLDRFAQIALVAARQAVTQSGLEMTEALALRSGVIMGTAGGGNLTVDDNYRMVYAEGKNRVHPFVVPRLMQNAATSHISMEFGLKGPAFTVSTACASANHAMGQAFQMVRTGMADIMLTGGSDAMLGFGGIKAWEGLRVMARDTCRPFSRDRSGMVQGEGGGVFVFEELDHARARGAQILAEVAGFGMSADAGDIVMPDMDGPVRAMRAALADAGVAPQDVGYVNAHGTGTAANDRVESHALRAVMGGHLDRLPVSSTKSMHGHIIGGTSAVEMLACLMALNEGVIAPTINHTEADPDCVPDPVPNEARQARVDVVMSNAFAFGGLNAVLVLRRLV